MPPSIHEVKAQHERRLLAIEGVVSVGVGRDSAGRPIIVIGLDKSRLRTMVQLPQTLDGYPVRVEVVGEIKAQ